MNVKIYAAQSPQEAEILISLLRNGGLHPLNLEMSPHVSLAGADMWYYIRIPVTEIELARDLLKSSGFENGIVQSSELPPEFGLPSEGMALRMTDKGSHKPENDDIQARESGTRRPLSSIAKFGYGILLPVMAFLAYQIALIETTRGDGSWAGITLFFGLAWIMPGLVLVNCWIIPLQWWRKRSAFLAGTILPSVVAIVESLWVHGSSESARAIKTALLGSPTRASVLILLLFAPLVASIVRAMVRGRNR